MLILLLLVFSTPTQARAGTEMYSEQCLASFYSSLHQRSWMEDNLTFSLLVARANQTIFG